MIAKKVSLLAMSLAASLGVLTGCGSWRGIELGNGEMVSGEYAVTSEIKRIEVDGVSATVHLTSEESDVVTYRIDENLEDLLEFEHKDGVLRICSKNDRTLGTGANIAFYVGTGVLSGVGVTGDAVIESVGTFEAETFTISVSGAASVGLDILCDRTEIEVSGAADISLSGATEELTAQVSGASNINAKNLEAQTASINISGAGNANVRAESSLDVTLSGAGNVTYWGDPEVSETISGLGAVKRGE